MIKKEGNKWKLFNKDGTKVLGTFDSEKAAKERERQINFFRYLDIIEKRKKK